MMKKVIILLLALVMFASYASGETVHVTKSSGAYFEVLNIFFTDCETSYNVTIWQDEETDYNVVTINAFCEDGTLFAVLTSEYNQPFVCKYFADWIHDDWLIEDSCQEIVDLWEAVEAAHGEIGF